MKLDLDNLFEVANITSKKTDAGVEIRDGRRLVYTIVNLDETTTRTVYPKGGEYTHTTMWNTPMSDDLIRKSKLNVLQSKLDIIRCELSR